MNAFSRGRTRILVATLCVAGLVLFGASTATADVNIKVRIEAPNATLFNGTVQTGAREILSEDLAGNASFCDSNDPSWPIPTVNSGGPTANSAVHDATGLLGLTYGTSGTRYSFGVAMCRIGSYGTDATNSWSVKINNQAHPGGGFVSGDTVVDESDEVLWYLGGLGTSRTLDLSLPATAVAGQPISGKVLVYKNADDKRVATVLGAAVSGGGAEADVRTDGTFKISFPEEGTFLIGASAPNAARGSAIINVGPPLSVAQLAEAQSRTAIRARACRTKYRKNRRKYKRCMRIVRAKHGLGI